MKKVLYIAQHCLNFLFYIAIWMADVMSNRFPKANFDYVHSIIERIPAIIFALLCPSIIGSVINILAYLNLCSTEKRNWFGGVSVVLSLFIILPYLIHPEELVKIAKEHNYDRYIEIFPKKWQNVLWCYIFYLILGGITLLFTYLTFS